MYRPVYIGSRKINIVDRTRKEYASLARIAYNRLTGKFNMNRFRSVLLAGGGALPLEEELRSLFKSSNVYSAGGGEGQWLNAIGFERMYQLRRRDANGA